MGLLEKWKNRETKKKLREENIRLKAEIEEHMKMPYPVCTVERNIQRVAAQRAFLFEEHVPVEIIKNKLMSDLSKYLYDFVEFDFFNNRHGGVVYSAELYVATGDRRK